jgi:hypothetical protein
LTLLSAATTVLPDVAMSQTHSYRTPRPGQTVRWVTVEGQTGRGRMLGVFQPGLGRLVLRTGHRVCSNFNPCAPETLDIAGLRELEVQVSSWSGRGARIGGIVGFLLGASFAAAMEGLDDSASNGPGADYIAYAAVGGLGALVFGGIGAIIGSQFQTWRPVEIPG